jgi:hypothetical protein
VNRTDSRTDLTVASGGTTSTSYRVAGRYALFSVALPAALTNTALAYEVSHDNATWFALRDNAGAAVAAVAVAASRSFPAPDQVAYYPYFRLVLSGVGNEAAARTISVYGKS